MKSEIKAKKNLSQKSRLQVQYDSLLSEIEKSKEHKSILESQLKKISPRINKEIVPLLVKRNEVLKARLIRLDELASEVGLSKGSFEDFAQYMLRELSILLKDVDFKDDALVEIYKKYKGESPQEEESLLGFASRIKEKYGFDVDLEKVNEVGIKEYLAQNEALFLKLAAQIKEKRQAEEVDAFDPHLSKKLRKHEHLQAQDAKKIYLELIKKFHPDRELDEKNKILKTAIVQDITKAYKEKDFFKLLSLHLKHINQEEIDSNQLSDDLLKRNIKELTKQLEALKNEIERINDKSNGIIYDFFDYKFNFSERKFKACKKELKAEIEAIKANNRYSFSFEKEWFKNWEKAIRHG